MPRTRDVPRGALRGVPIVENERLGRAVSTIQVSQAERDEARLASKKLPLREKECVRAAAGRSTPPAIAPATSDRLGGVLEYLEEFEAKLPDGLAVGVPFERVRRALGEGERNGNVVRYVGYHGDVAPEFAAFSVERGIVVRIRLTPYSGRPVLPVLRSHNLPTAAS